MPVLSNPKHEAFVQGVVKGMTQEAAYEAAGYAPNRSHAARLVANGNVAARIAELQSEAAKEAVVTAADIARQLDEDRAFARESGNPSAAVSATMGKAKVLGLLTEKVQHDGNVNHFVAGDPASLPPALAFLAGVGGGGEG